MKNVYLILIGLFATSCATVGSVIEGGKEIASNSSFGLVCKKIQNKPEESLE